MTRTPFGGSTESLSSGCRDCRRVRITLMEIPVSNPTVNTSDGCTYSAFLLRAVTADSLALTLNSCITDFEVG